MGEFDGSFYGTKYSYFTTYISLEPNLKTVQHEINTVCNKLRVHEKNW